MKLFAKTALGLAVAIASTTALSSDLINFDPSLKVTYKNYFWKQKNEARTSDVYYRDEWVQGLVATFDTGYFLNDMFGAVVTGGFADPLRVKDGSSISNVAKGSDGKANGIAGLQQAFRKEQTEPGRS